MHCTLLLNFLISTRTCNSFVRIKWMDSHTYQYFSVWLLYYWNLNTFCLAVSSEHLNLICWFNSRNQCTLDWSFSLGTWSFNSHDLNSVCWFNSRNQCTLDWSFSQHLGKAYLNINKYSWSNHVLNKKTYTIPVLSQV